MLYDIIIVGAGPAGLTAAVYARRANKSVLLVITLIPRLRIQWNLARRHQYC